MQNHMKQDFTLLRITNVGPRVILPGEVWDIFTSQPSCVTNGVSILNWMGLLSLNHKGQDKKQDKYSRKKSICKLIFLHGRQGFRFSPYGLWTRRQDQPHQSKKHYKENDD